MSGQGGIAQRLAECVALADHGEPLTPSELATYNSQRAAEMARAEARRQPSPQLDLDQAA